MLKRMKATRDKYSAGLAFIVAGRNPWITVRMYPSSIFGRAGSLMRKNPITPTAVTTPPMMVKIAVQLDARSRSKAINPPNTARIATSGIMALTPSAAPRLVASVLSVSQALKAASLAVEPKKVITQSRTITSVMPMAEADAAMGKAAWIRSSRSRVKPKMEMPHSMYPPQMKIRRRPILSERAPISTVVSVAATALAATMAEISPAVALNILYMNTFRYMFSTTQAICPIRLSKVRATQNFFVSFVFISKSFRRIYILCFYYTINSPMMQGNEKRKPYGDCRMAVGVVIILIRQ